MSEREQKKVEFAAFNEWAWKKDGPAIGQMDGQEAALAAWMARAAQITPQAGESEPHAWVYEFDDPDPQTDIEFGAECPKGWKRHIARGAVYPLYRTAPPRPVGPTAGDILISRDAAMTVLARWVYDEHWMKASDDMLAVAVQPSPVAPTDSEAMKALRYLMQQFDGEIWCCPICGHEESTSDMDSANWLRDWLEDYAGPPDSPGAGGL